MKTFVHRTSSGKLRFIAHTYSNLLLRIVPLDKDKIVFNNSVLIFDSSCIRIVSLKLNDRELVEMASLLCRLSKPAPEKPLRRMITL